MEVTTKDGNTYTVLNIKVEGQTIAPSYVKSFDFDSDENAIPFYVMKKDDGVWIGLDKQGTPVTEESRTMTQIVQEYSGQDTVKVGSDPNIYQIIYSPGL